MPKFDVFRLAQWRAVCLVLAAVLLAGCQSMPKGLSAQQIAVLEAHGFQPGDAGWELDMSTKVLFATDESSLSATSRETVIRVGKALVEVGITQLRIDGHTDSAGSDAYNDALSLRRAEEVAQVLVEHAGFLPDAIAARGLGKRVPTSNNRTASGRAENRRVSIVVANQ